MMRGKGGFLASDLTEYARTYAPRSIKEAILNPGKFSDRSTEMVQIATSAGDHLSGVIRNEDNFSLQIQSVDGAFHLLMKSEIDRMDRSASSKAHAEYGHRLTASELEDVVSYLSQGTHETARKAAKTVGGHRRTCQTFSCKRDAKALSPAC